MAKKISVTDPVEKHCVSLSSIINKGKQLPTSLQAVYTFNDPDLKTLEPVTGVWTIRGNGTGVSVKGSFEGLIEQECFRCLAPCLVPVKLELDEAYVLNSCVALGADEKELLIEDDSEVVSPDGDLDLRHLIYQFLVLEYCYQVFCDSETCQIDYKRPE